MPPNNRPQREPEIFAPDDRPEADQWVYCKGCGTRLESRARLTKPKAAVTSMMCEPCQEKHGHALMPASGEPTFCYRCGGPDQIFIAPGTSPAIHHVCPRCLPDRAARYAAGNFDPPLKQPTEEAAPAAPATTAAKA